MWSESESRYKPASCCYTSFLSNIVCFLFQNWWITSWTTSFTLTFSPKKFTNSSICLHLQHLQHLQHLHLQHSLCDRALKTNTATISSHLTESIILFNPLTKCGKAVDRTSNSSTQSLHNKLANTSTGLTASLIYNWFRWLVMDSIVMWVYQQNASALKSG